MEGYPCARAIFFRRRWIGAGGMVAAPLSAMLCRARRWRCYARRGAYWCAGSSALPPLIAVASASASGERIPVRCGAWETKTHVVRAASRLPRFQRQIYPPPPRMLVIGARRKIGEHCARTFALWLHQHKSERAPRAASLVLRMCAPAARRITRSLGSAICCLARGQLSLIWASRVRATSGRDAIISRSAR